MEKIKIDDLIHRASTGDYEVHGNELDGGCVIGFSFGFRKDGNKIIPGLSNKQLALCIKERFARLQKILQFEIADALGDSTAIRIEKHRTPSAYLNTREVAEQALVIMKERGYKKPIIVAHPFHMPRTDAICQKLGMQTIAPHGLESVQFDQKSEQPWTRDQASWISKEATSIKRYAEQGKI